MLQEPDKGVVKTFFLFSLSLFFPLELLACKHGSKVIESILPVINLLTPSANILQ